MGGSVRIVVKSTQLGARMTHHEVSVNFYHPFVAWSVHFWAIKAIHRNYIYISSAAMKMRSYFMVSEGIGKDTEDFYGPVFTIF